MAWNMEISSLTGPRLHHTSHCNLLSPSAATLQWRNSIIIHLTHDLFIPKRQEYMPKKILPGKPQLPNQYTERRRGPIHSHGIHKPIHPQKNLIILIPGYEIAYYRKYGNNGPSTIRSNKKVQATNGIWGTEGINI